MLIVDMPKKYLSDASGFVSCAMCQKYLPLLYRDCHKDFKGCLIKGELIRCGECKHHEVFKNGVNGWCNGHGCPADVTYFCADGERKDGAGK